MARKPVTVEGVGNLERNLFKFGILTNGQMRRVVHDTTERVRVYAQRLAPDRSGKGKRSIFTGYDDEQLRGWVTHTRETFYLLFNEFGTRHQPARPFFRPAAERQRTRHTLRAISVMKSLVSRSG